MIRMYGVWSLSDLLSLIDVSGFKSGQHEGDFKAMNAPAHLCIYEQHMFCQILNNLTVVMS